MAEKTLIKPKPVTASPDKRVNGKAVQRKPANDKSTERNVAPSPSFLQTSGGVAKRRSPSSWSFSGSQSRGGTGGNGAAAPATARGKSATVNPAARAALTQQLVPQGKSAAPKQTAPATSAAPKAPTQPVKQAPASNPQTQNKQTTTDPKPIVPLTPSAGTIRFSAVEKTPAASTAQATAPVTTTSRSEKQSTGTPDAASEAAALATRKQQEMQQVPGNAKKQNPTTGRVPANETPLPPQQAETRSKNLMTQELREAERGGRSEPKVVPGKPIVIAPKNSAQPDNRPPVNAAAKAAPAAATPAAPGKQQARKNPVIAPNKNKSKQVKAAARKTPKESPEQAAPVEAAAPVDLRAHVSTRALSTPEFIQTVRRGEHHTGRATVQQRLARSTGIATQAKTRVRTAATQKKAAATTQKQTTVQAITQAAVQQEQESAAFFEQQLQGLQAAKESKLSQLQTLHQTAIQQHQSATDTNKESGLAALEQKKQGFRDHVNSEKAALTQMANAEADRCDSELDAAANQALAEGERAAAPYSGSEDPKPDQRHAATQVGVESANDIRDKKVPLRVDLRQRAADYALRYDEFLTDIQQKIEDAKTQLRETVTEIGSSSIRELSTKLEQASTTVNEKVAEGTSSLQQQKESNKATIQEVKEQKIRLEQNLFDETIARIDTASQQTAEGIDALHRQTQQHLSSGAPYVPGAQEMIQHHDQAVQRDAQACVNALQGFETAFRTASGNFVTQTTTALNQAKQQATQRATATSQQTQSTIDRVSQSLEDDCNLHQQSMEQRQSGFINELKGEVDKAINAAKEKIAGFRRDFAVQLRQAADEALLEAKKPLYDQTGTRANEAAIRAGETAFEGFLRAVGDILIGLVIVIVVALIVAAIAAAFSVILTAWTAMMIAGAILLVIGLVLALRHRYVQARDEGHSYAIMFWALGDVTGVTMITEAIYGRDIVTDQALSTGEAVYRGTTGVFTAIMVFMGVRSAMKGPPAGTFTRPGSVTFEFPGWGELFTNMREGWRGFGELFTAIRESFVGIRELLPSMWEGISSVAGEMMVSFIGRIMGGRDFIMRMLRRATGREAPERAPAGDETLPRASAVIELAEIVLRVVNKRFVPGNETTLGEWQWDLVVETPEGLAKVSDQYVYTEGTNSPVSGPEQYLRPRQAVMPDGSVREIRLSEGRKFDWTVESIRAGVAEFQRTFGYPPWTLSGELADANLSNFQTEFANLRTASPELSVAEIANRAIRNISFGRNRIANGYDQFDVRVSDFADVTVTGRGGTTTTLENVPRHVEVDARPGAAPPVVPGTRRDEGER